MNVLIHWNICIHTLHLRVTLKFPNMGMGRLVLVKRVLDPRGDEALQLEWRYDEIAFYKVRVDVIVEVSHIKGAHDRILGAIKGLHPSHTPSAKEVNVFPGQVLARMLQQHWHDVLDVSPLWKEACRYARQHLRYRFGPCRKGLFSEDNLSS